jgi:hypothetical protein
MTDYVTPIGQKMANRRAILIKSNANRPDNDLTGLKQASYE